MTSVRALANLLCNRCGEITLHSANVCQREGCGHINRDSGNPPTPRPRSYGYSTMKASQYDAGAGAEAASARRRARAARHQIQSRAPR